MLAHERKVESMIRLTILMYDFFLATTHTYYMIFGAYVRFTRYE